MRARKGEPISGRRRFLELMAGGLVAGIGAPLGCVSGSDREPARIPLESLPAGGRIRVLAGENPVELQRAAAGAVTGRSLWCTHFGCEVAWSEERAVYLCPCHDGVFDAQGRPISGPPVRALASVPVSVENGEILVGVADSEVSG